ncbi:MAG: glycosyltransferase family 4 protein [Sphingobacteriales bacterium]|nr:glycosyltransferase family 4 protein [Sphingobacteriales bacterium]
MKTRITYILFQINKALAFEWIIDHIDKSRFELSFISIAVPENSPLEQFCSDRKMPFYRIDYQGKKDMPAAIYKTYAILRAIKPDAVHCHIFEANIIGLSAAWLAGVKKRIFTRHHSTFHHTTSPKGIKYDRYCNRLATHIIAISENVKNILIVKEQVPPEKVFLIHHGFDLPLFNDVSDKRLERIRQKYNRNNRHPVIGVISRYTEWKGIKYVLSAYRELLVKYPNALLVLANAKGEDEEIRLTITKFPKETYTEIVFEQDNAALFKLFDVFVHVPIDAEIEAFGQIYVEALAVGVPSIFTMSGIACEFIRHRENALVVEFQNSAQIYESICDILGHKELRDKLSINGKKDVEQLFSLPLMIHKLEKIYSS